MDDRDHMLKFVTLSILLAASGVSGAASIGYVITDHSDPMNHKEIARGTKSYSLSDIHVERRKDGNQFFYDKSLETLHFSTGKEAVLRDIASGSQLAAYGLRRVDGDIPASALEQAPAWVREIPHIED